MIIKNRAELATTELRIKALDIIEAGIERVLPTNIIKYALYYDTKNRVLTINNTAYNLSRGRLFVIGGGKASGLMAEALESIIPPEDITAGIVNCKDSDYKTGKIKVVTAGHPIPDCRGVGGVKEMLSLRNKYSIGRDDTIICLISGGGSALMPYPATGIKLEDKQKITELLLASGAEISEINIVRKHLSRIKGGQLGFYFSPSTVISLILSDVIGNDLSVIASGPTYPDTTTFSDACNVLKKYDLLSTAPERMLDHLEKGCRGKVAETTKRLDNCYNYIIGDNRLALEAMLIKAQETGFTPHLVTAEQKGDTTEAALKRANEILKTEYAGYDALIIGGETTPRLPAPAGRGGRNQHYAAVSILAMEGYRSHWLVASVGSDGSDFLPDVAGAIVDGSSLAKANDNEINIKAYLDRYDSNTLLKQIGNSLVVTGNTGTNVGDLMLYLLK
jgi:hydroxypyruvate reductase/glycerate 2-kinase